MFISQSKKGEPSAHHASEGSPLLLQLMISPAALAFMSHFIHSFIQIYSVLCSSRMFLRIFFLACRNLIPNGGAWTGISYFLHSWAC